MDAARAADEWWHTLPEERRLRIFGWLGPKEPTHHPVEGQYEIPIPAPRTRR